jgi:hypothetical protein
MHCCCQAENLIDDDDQIEKLYIDFGHGGAGVWEILVFVAFILLEDRGRRKDFLTVTHSIGIKTPARRTEPTRPKKSYIRILIDILIQKTIMICVLNAVLSDEI